MAKIMYNGKNYSMGVGAEPDAELNEFSENPIQNKVVTEALNNKLNISDISEWAKAETKPEYTPEEVGADEKGSADTVLNSAKNYVDGKISDLINGAPETLDTLKEVANAIEENETVVEALNTAVGTKANSSDLTAHTGNTSNPHSVTKDQVGLSNVPNVSTNDQTPTYSDTTVFETLSSGEKISVAFAKIKLAITNLINHIANKSNPHEVTKTQLGLGNVENKSSSTIRGELTKENVTTALGYTPPTTNTTYSNMIGASASVAGTAGLVPAPAAGNQAKYLRGDGTWQTPPDTNTTYNAVSESANGLATPALLASVNNALPKTGGTVTGKTTFSGGLSITSASANDSMPYFLGINAFTDGGNVYYITASNVKSAIGLGSVNNTADANKSVASAAKLTTARTINDTSFDGTANIRIANAWNLALGAVGNEARFCTFARMAKSNASGNGGGTFIVTDLGDYGGTLTGAWLVQISNRGSVATMNVTTIHSHSSGNVTFGYYTSGDFFYFGVYTTAYRASGNITVLRNTGVTFHVFSDTTAAPSGWTSVAVRTLQDTNTTYSAVTDSANGLATPDLLSKANSAVPKSGATMTGALVGQANANYTTAQFRNITMSTSAPSGGSNGQVHLQYS